MLYSLQILFNKLFTKFTCDPLLIKNLIPMGIEKLNKKNPPTLASSLSATST